MPAPKDDRAALERERDELPALITTYEHELLATPVERRFGWPISALGWPSLLTLLMLLRTAPEPRSANRARRDGTTRSLVKCPLRK